MRVSYILLLLLFLFNNLLAQQNHQIDSLKSALKSAKNAADKLSTYDILATKMAYSNADSALLISNEYLNLALANKDEVRITKAKNSRGLCYFLKSDYKNASVYFIQAIKEFEKQGDKYNVAVALNNLAASYEHIESPDATIKNFQKAHEIFKEINNTHWIGITAGNLSNNYLLKLNDLANAEKYAKVAVESAKITGDKNRQAEASLTLGNVLFTAKKYTDAANAYDSVTRLVNSDSYPLLFGSARVNQGSCLTETGDYDAAIRFTTEAKEIFIKQKTWAYLSLSWQALIEINERKKDFKAAFEAQKGFIASNDSLQVQQKRNEMIDALRKYESEKKEQENKLLITQLKAEKQTKVFTLIGIALLALLATVIGFALRKNSRKNAQLAHQNSLITQQKDKLTELNIEKNNLISIVSHDLRSPFNAIDLWNKMLQENLSKSPIKVAEATEMIGKTVIYGQNLINNILDIEKIDINSHQVELKETNLSGLLNELIANFEPAANGKNIKIDFTSSVSDVTILTDSVLLRRAIENLISNALKFSYQDSVVNVFLEENQNEILIKVQDFGVGIAKNEQQNLFSKYGKISTQPTAGEASTGLGLSITKRIADELGGKISFKSESGRGSEFCFTLKK